MKDKYDIGVQELVNIYLDTERRWSESREKSLDCYGFCMNRQWNAAEIEKFLKENRPPIV